MTDTSNDQDRGRDREYIRLYRVLFNEERTRIDTDHDVMGWGIQFPSGLCYVDWNREAYPPEDRLDNPHVSEYGSLDDVRQGTGGDVEVFYEHPVDRYLAVSESEPVTTVACVHCNSPMSSLGEASEHHASRHPSKLFDPAWYAELVGDDQ